MFVGNLCLMSVNLQQRTNLETAGTLHAAQPPKTVHVKWNALAESMNSSSPSLTTNSQQNNCQTARFDCTEDVSLGRQSRNRGLFAFDDTNRCVIRCNKTLSTASTNDLRGADRDTAAECDRIAK